MSLGTVLKTYNQLASLPFGKKIFSILFSLKAPYFANIRATVNDLKPGTGITRYLSKLIIILNLILFQRLFQ